MKQILKPELSGMPPFRWREEYKINIREIDEHHQEVFNKADKFYDAIEEKKDKALLETALNDLVHSIQSHFVKEETLMSKHNYPILESHQKKHQLIFKEILDFQSSFRKNNFDINRAALGFLKN